MRRPPEPPGIGGLGKPDPPTLGGLGGRSRIPTGLRLIPQSAFRNPTSEIPHRPRVTRSML